MMQDAPAPASVCPAPAVLHSQQVQFDSLGRTVPVDVVVPAAAQSLLFVLDAAGSRLTTAQLSDPSGVELVPDGWLERSSGGNVCIECVARVTVGFARHVALVPNRPGIVVEPGVWSASFARLNGEGATGELVVTALVGDLAVTRRSLPVTVLLAGEADLAGAAGLDSALDRLTSIYEAAGITLTATAVPAPDLARAPTAESVAALSPIAGLSVVLVDQIVTADGTALLGLSPTPGAVPSGVVFVTRDAPDLGRAMAHEIGHFLGLFHPNEPNQRDLHDPVPDTPLTDSDNLMDVFADGVSLTPQQRALIGSHPALSFECD